MFRLSLVAITLLLSGCAAYKVPKFVTAETSETVFVVPMLGDTSSQGKINSEEFLEKSLVSTKRIEVPQLYVQTGRMWFTGHWTPAARVIKVDRAPVTRTWCAGGEYNDNAIWVESEDSVGFSVGVTITARILTDKEAVTFLYNYPGEAANSEAAEAKVNLAHVMDKEIRARVQKIFSEEAAKTKMDLLRTQKNSIMKAVETDVIPFFKKRGIEITTIGMYKGFDYENKATQDTIDKVFQAEQEKNVAKAKEEAQLAMNKSIKLKAEGEAEAARLKAKGEADAIKTVADAKSYEVSKTTEKSETYLKLKEFEILMKQLERWDGKFPVYFMGNSPNTLLQLPTPVKK